MPYRLALNAVKLTVAATIVALGCLDGDTTSSSAVPQPSYVGAERTYRLLEAHSCSTTGFDTSQQPLSAIVRSASGDLRFVDFDTGWRVYTRRGAAALVAVCLDDPPA